jgi:DNA-binding NarL/FixJ family response regulator
MAARVRGRTTALDGAVAEALDWLAGGDGSAPGVQNRTVEADGEALMDGWLAPSDETVQRAAPSGFAALTRRERDVAVLLARGQTTNREIAAALVITEGTAANYVQRVLNRLELRTRAQVAAWAAEHQIHEGQPSG